MDCDSEAIRQMQEYVDGRKCMSIEHLVATPRVNSVFSLGCIELPGH